MAAKPVLLGWCMCAEDVDRAEFERMVTIAAGSLGERDNLAVARLRFDTRHGADGALYHHAQADGLPR